MVVSAEEARTQIEQVKKLECAVVTPEGEQVSWQDVDDPKEPRTLFQFIEADREKRAENLMADRPPFAVVTVQDRRAVRLQFYEGHDALSKSYDLRSKELQGEDLGDFLESDPQAYDPAAFVAENYPDLVEKLGGEEAARQILGALHRDT